MGFGMYLPSPSSRIASSVSTVLPFLGCYVAKVGAIECLAFSNGHLPLSNMHLNLLHVFLWFDRKIIPAQYFTVWIYQFMYPFIHLLKNILAAFDLWQL